MNSQNSRTELNDLLFDNFISNDEYIKNMQSICKDLKPKIYPEKMSKIFNNRLDIAVIQNSEIYFLSKYFYKNLQDKLINGKTKDEKNYNEIEKLKESINPSNFFTDNEIEEYEGLDNIDYTIVKNDSAVVFTTN